MTDKAGSRRPVLTSRRLLPFAAFVALLVLWEWSVIAFHVRPFVLPRPSQVAVALVTDASQLIPAAFATAAEIVLGFLLAILIAVPLAVVLAASRWVETALLPVIVSAQLIPKVALAPLLTVWLGLGIATKLTVAFLLSFFPILIDTMVGLKSVETGKIPHGTLDGRQRNAHVLKDPFAKRAAKLVRRFEGCLDLGGRGGDSGRVHWRQCRTR